MEEKEKKLRPLHLRTDEGKIIEGTEANKSGTKDEMSSKMEDVKKGASEKKDDIKAAEKYDDCSGRIILPGLWGV